MTFASPKLNQFGIGKFGDGPLVRVYFTKLLDPLEITGNTCCYS